MANRIVFPRELLYGFEIIEPHQRGELDLISGFMAKKIYLSKPRNASSLNTRNYIATNDFLISVGILGRSPSMPYSTNHAPSIRVLQKANCATTRFSHVKSLARGPIR